jgi:hypothetical protein
VVQELNQLKTSCYITLWIRNVLKSTQSTSDGALKVAEFHLLFYSATNILVRLQSLGQQRLTT